MDNIVEDYKKYLQGLEYNQSLYINGRGYYETIDAVIAFVNGDQWRNSDETDLPKPVFNMLEPIEGFKVANIASTSIKVKFEPIDYREDAGEEMDAKIIASELLSSEVNAVMHSNDFDIDIEQRNLLADGFETGDYGVHILFDADKPLFDGKEIKYKENKGMIKLEIVDGQNVMFGNPNNNDIEKQPYVCLVGRDMVSNLQDEVKTNTTVIPDYDYTYMAGDKGKLEIKGDNDGKALYVITYTRDKKTRKIKVSKCVQNGYIYKDVDMGIDYYPIAFGNWKKTKNCYHGTGAAIGVIPNQIAINKLFAMYIYHTGLTAFPTLMYDITAMGGAWTSQLGLPVGVRLEPTQQLKDTAHYLQTGNLGNNIQLVIDLIKRYTMELLGVNDTAMGNVSPDNTSAIIAVQKSTAVPLENPKSNFYKFCKSLALRIADRIINNYGVRPIVHEVDGQKQIVMYDFNILKTFCNNAILDVGPSGYYSDVATNNTLNNLLQGQYISFVQFLERVDDSLIPEKQKLIDELKGAVQGNNQQDNETMAQFFDSLPAEQQAQLKALPDAQFEEAVKQLMDQQGTTQQPTQQNVQPQVQGGTQ